MPRTPSQALEISPTQGSVPLTPQQKRFNTLIRQIGQARETLAAWRDGIDTYRQTQAEAVRPLEAEWRATRRRWAFALDALHAQAGWTRSQRDLMSELICEAAAGLLEGQRPGGALDAELHALFVDHAGVTFEEDQVQRVQAMKDMAEEMSGLDLGDSDDLRTEADLYERMRQAAAAQAQDPDSDEAQRQARRTRRQTAAQQRREAEARQATQSVREVFRKLASALHPDREPDPEQRAAKTALMQQANRAYAANDLLALLELQLQAEQIDAGHLADASTERLKHYNQVLADQLAELKAEVDAVRVGWCMEFGVSPEARLTPSTLGLALEEEMRQRRAELAGLETDMRRMTEPASAKRWLRQQRELMQQRDDFNGFGLF